MFKKISFQIENKYNGEIPKNERALQCLYGLGRYLANAVLCFGLDKDVVLLYTNINRIISRFFNAPYPKKVTDNDPLWNKLQNNAGFKENNFFF